MGECAYPRSPVLPGTVVYSLPPPLHLSTIPSSPHTAAITTMGANQSTTQTDEKVFSAETPIQASIPHPPAACPR